MPLPLERDASAAQGTAALRLAACGPLHARLVPAIGSWGCPESRPAPSLRGLGELSCPAPEIAHISLPALATPRLAGVVFPERADLLGSLGDARRSSRVAEGTSPNTTSTAPESQGADRPSHQERADWHTTAARTRIEPPRDVVRLEDRLFYLLQPPLQQLMSAESLKFPFRPFPYQWDGIAYLYPRHEAVLADEMGLGKTMQTVATLRLLAHQGEVRRALLVCPKPLVTNWRREFAQWAPELPVTIVEGRQCDREWLWQHATEGVLLANYELLVRDRELAAAQPAFDLMVIDEAQRIKNRNGATHGAVCSVQRQRSWALTGTPIENSADDLVGIFDFVSPGRVQPQMRLPALRTAVHDHVLRRTKDQVLTELPPKMIRDAEITLSPEQRAAYLLAEEEGIVRLSEMGCELTIRHVFQLVLRLKQICNFDPVSGASSKLEQLTSDLEECVASGRKAIVFSQWVGTIERIAAHLGPLRPLQYHGKIRSSHRDGIIEEFRHDPTRRVLLMSYGAGSVGLNLQFTQYVFLFDRWWNPAIEDQAINRAHRIGAAGPVTVTRMLAVNTIEERIQRVLEEKRELFQAVFDPDESPRRLGLSRDDIFGLFNLELPAAA